MTEIALHTPLLEKPAIHVGGNIFRKQVLPVGTLNYEGRTLTFDKPYLSQLVDAFDKRAVDSVPVVLADTANQHTMDPERMRGEVRAFDLTDDGLYAVLSLSDDAARLVEANPSLGVSARILENHERQDGTGSTVFPAATQHVLMTTQPRVAGMKPWERVDLSASTTPVIDLSALTYQEGIMTTPTPGATSDPMAALVATLSPEQRTALQAALGTHAAPAPAAAADAMDALLDRVLAGQATAEELAQVFGGEPVPSITQVPAPAPAATAPVVPASPAVEVAPALAVAGASLAAPAGQALELAQANARIAQLEVTQAAAAWAAERAALTSAGVPPALLDLATPVMVAPGASVIALAGGQQADSKQAMRAMLLAAKGTVDLSGPAGHLTGADPAEQADPRTDPAYQTWTKDYQVPGTFTY